MPLQNMSSQNTANRPKLLIVLCAFMLALVLLPACSSTSGSSGSSSSGSSSQTSSGQSSGYTTVSVEEAKQMIDAGGITVVDVRRSDEYASGHLPGAINVPNEDISKTQPEALPDKDAKLLVYCRTGVRSAQASTKLVDMGYTQVYNMDGGITAWKYDTE